MIFSSISCSHNLKINKFHKMSKTNELIQNDDVTQAVLIADNYNDAFLPITNDLPLALLPVVNRPLIDYTLEFLALGGIEETFLFCSSHANAIKEFVRKGKQDNSTWSQTMEVIIIVSESCGSLGDCMRDLDAKGLIRGNFVLAEPGVISNMKLLPIIKKHNEVTKKDKSAAMTLIYQETGLGQFPQDEVLLAVNSSKRILFHRRLCLLKEKKIHFPLDIFLENSNISLQHNLKDTHVAICSPSVLPLFSDNFDYQTRDDLIKGLLMIDEVQDSTIYSYIINGAQHGGAVTNWSSYHAISHELMDRWFYPIITPAKRARGLDKVVTGKSYKISSTAFVSRSFIGDNVTIADGAIVEDSIILSNTKLEKCTIRHSLIGNNVTIKEGCEITFGSIIGNGTVLPKNTKLHDTLLQSTKPDDCEDEDKIGEKAYKLILEDEDDDESLPDGKVTEKLSRLHICEATQESEDDGFETSDSEDGLSYTTSPVPDDTNMFLTEVMDSLARGFEDKLQCDNLILEINSSRYAYNVTLKEVHYNVAKAILNLPFQQSGGQPYLQALSPSLAYFSPILKNYIRNEEAMADCLQAIEEVAATNNELHECVVKILNWFYDKDHLSEQSILKWYHNLEENGQLHKRVKPFAVWLEKAEEETSEEESE